MSDSAEWQFWVDRGGTFTDIVARKPDGALATQKLLSENPERHDDAAVQGIRELLGLGNAQQPTAAQVDTVKMGTTVATKALLERKGERTLLVITKGFHDALRIAYQNRPKLFTRRIDLPEVLYEQAIEADDTTPRICSTISPSRAPTDPGPGCAAQERDFSGTRRCLCAVGGAARLSILGQLQFADLIAMHFVGAVGQA